MTEATGKLPVGGGMLARSPEALDRWVNGEPQGPLAIEVAVAGGCNQGCLHCGFQQFKPYEQQKKFIDKASFLNFIDDFAELGGREVYFAGSGEPLLNPDLSDYVRRGHELGLSMAMSSNGIPWSERRIKAMLPHMSWIRFSVNGGTADSYHRIHRGNPTDFYKLWRNLEIAVRIREQERLPVRLVIQSVVYQDNLGSIGELVKRFIDVGLDDLVIRGVADDSGACRPLGDDGLERLRPFEEERGVQVRWDSFQPDEGPIGWRRCYGINFRTNMDEFGNLFSCNRHLFENSIFGNIHRHTFREIWEGETRRRLFGRIEQGADIPRCGKWCQVGKDNLYSEQMLEKGKP